MGDISPADPGAAVGTSRADKVKAIFSQFDKNDDGRLSKEEMAALVVAVNPSVRFSEEQITAILDEVFRTYGEYIDGGGLSLDGLRRTYDDGAGDVDRDFDALGLTLAAIDEANVDELKDEKKGKPGLDFSDVESEAPSTSSSAAPSSTVPAEMSAAVKQLLEELETLLQTGPTGGTEDGEDSHAKVGTALAEMRHRADTLRSPDESFEAHLEMGSILGLNGRWEEALKSYRRAVALRPEESKAFFRIGNALYSLNKYTEARDSYERALQVARIPADARLLPQIHVNLGVALEADGFLMGACEHYREAAILNPQHHRALKLLGSALYALGELHAAEEALQHAITLRPDYADAQVDLGSALSGLGQKKEAMDAFKSAIELDSNHVEALFNLANMHRTSDQFDQALKLYDRALQLDPSNWKVSLNRSVCMLAMGKGDETKDSIQKVYKQTGKRLEIYELLKMLKRSGKKDGWNPKLSKKLATKGGTGSTHGQPPQARTLGSSEAAAANTGARFTRDSVEVSTPEQVAVALEVRGVGKLTRLKTCTPSNLRREASDDNLPDDRRYAAEGKIVRKANVERIFRRLLDASVASAAFADAMKHINQRMLAVLDKDEMGTVDLGKVLSVVAILCSGTVHDRKRTAYDVLLWRAGKNLDSLLPRKDAVSYFGDLRTVYKAPPVSSSAPDSSAADAITFQEFSTMFEEDSIGFPYLTALLKFEETDRIRHHGITCGASGYQIVGPRYRCVNGKFDLCAASYAAKQTPKSNLQEFIFKEYLTEPPVTKLSKFACYSPASTVGAQMAN
mmetsp:Transcript_10083/g.11784  ORF Transcript_10083/g.11784 Transcript_10083/m.11784 type:complete len:797 (-) Transcript_10083:746-3136(-)|eukprot:CAMPEP_0197847488 /NCGR_PEP_ID=MMETSP1438-20131217/6341_1 /TAXON_ID=1461541 /ORGANISM="Pterosperma sp., Strain CCMP1384" /LENGTH=796 /DNA_ID=CAMNT_0043459427 /DNA_START=122 /DNA_END=2512 /DNA_ORIENTATION=+